MALAINTQVVALDPGPSSNTAGLIVSNFSAAFVTVGQYNDIAAATLNHFALTDDEQYDNNGQPTDASTFPDGILWPQMDDQARTKFSDFVQLISLEGIERWRPSIGEWVTTGPSPSLQLKARLLTDVQVQSLGNLEAMAGLSDIEINRLVVLAEDNDCPVDLISGAIINPEVANVITLELHARDQPNVPLAELVRFEIALLDANAELYDAADYTANVTGPGSNVSNADRPNLWGSTDSSGDATISITDVVGATSGFVFVRIIPHTRLGGIVRTFVFFDGV